ncbi:MAG: S-layer homology domain-containing protein [Symbiobacteriia bacterium]
MKKKIMPLLALALVVLLVNASLALADTGAGTGTTTTTGTNLQSGTTPPTITGEGEDGDKEEGDKEDDGTEVKDGEKEQEDDGLEAALEASAGDVKEVDEEIEDGVQLTVPQDGSVTNAQTIDISGVAKEGYQVVVKVKNASGEQTFTATADASGAINLAALNLAPGKNKLEIAVYDANGKKVREMEKRVVLPGAQLPTLKDVKNSWAKDTIAKLTALGIVSGNPDGTFKPDDDVNGAQFIKMLDGAANLQASSQQVQGFGELSKDFWANGYIAAAQSEGIVKGDDDKAFDPNQPLTRTQMAVLLVRALGLEDKAEALAGTNSAFTDSASIPDWAQGYVELAVQIGLLKGMPDGSFQPNLPADRAQAAALIERFLNAKETLPAASTTSGTATSGTTTGTVQTVTP